MINSDHRKEREAQDRGKQSSTRPIPTLRHLLELTWYKAIAELRVEASRSYIGLLWWVVEPLTYMIVFYVVFEVGLRSNNNSDAVAFLLCGLVPWKWFNATVQTSSNVMVSNSALIGQAYFPKWVLIGVVGVANTIKYLILLALLLAFIVLDGHAPNRYWLLLPVLMVIQGILIFGAACILALIQTYFRDFRIIVDNGLLLLFFTSGAFFDISKRSETVQHILYLNPMSSIIESMRDILLQAHSPNWDHLLPLLFFSSLLVVV